MTAANTNTRLFTDDANTNNAIAGGLLGNNIILSVYIVITKIHCWKILLILVLEKVASKTQYSPLCNCKVMSIGFYSPLCDCKVMSIGFYSPFYMFFFAFHSFDFFLQILQGFFNNVNTVRSEM